MKVTLKIALAHVPVGSVVEFTDGRPPAQVVLPRTDVADPDSDRHVTTISVESGLVLLADPDHEEYPDWYLAVSGMTLVEWTAEASDIAHYLAKVAREEAIDASGERDVF